MKSTVDGRPWDRDMAIKWQGAEKGSVRAQRCKGSYRCEYENCPFKQQHGKSNDVQFEKNRDNNIVCKSCGRSSLFIPCSARKYMEFLSDIHQVRIYHTGSHTCKAKRKAKLPDFVQESLLKNPKLKPSELVRQSIVENLKKPTVDWDELEKTADALLDTKKISNLKAKLKKESNPAGSSFEAVAHLKQKANSKDEFFIYKMNDREMNADEPSYVFKTSKLKINLARSMADENHFLSNEYCYIDGKFNRCKDFPTITLSVYHPVLRKQIALFTMECEGETAECYTKFFDLINEVVGKVAEDEIFLPIAGFMEDENGALQVGLQRVYGESIQEQLKTCEFHYLQSANRQRSKLHSEKSKDFFTRVTRSLLQAQTSSAYNDIMQELKEFIAKKPAKDQRGFLIPWLQWWDDRRSHVFAAFSRKNAPRSNLAEVIHSKWKTTGGEGLSLVDAAAEDMKESLLLEREFVG